MPYDEATPADQLSPVADALSEVAAMGVRLRLMRWVFSGSLALIILGQLKPLAPYTFAPFPWMASGLGLWGCISAGHWAFKGRQSMTKPDKNKWVYILLVVSVVVLIVVVFAVPNLDDKKLAYTFGVLFVVVLVVVAFAVPKPTDFQYTVFRIVLALAAAGVAAMIPGILELSISNWLRAGGALAVFVIVFFKSPAALVANPK